MFYQKNTLSLFVAGASLLSHNIVHAKPSTLRGALLISDFSNEGKRNLSGAERSYLLVDERKNFGEARAHCMSQGMDLASITNEEENRVVAQLCKSAKNGSLCWIGLSPQWLDGTEYIYRKNDLQDAVVISGKQRSWIGYGGWRYSKGQKERAFICSSELIPEITSSSTTVTTTMTTKPTTTTTKMATTSTTTTDSVEATEFMCPTNWTPYGSNQKCLKVINQGKSFSGHESNCQSIAPKGWSGSLVSFHSQDDLDVAGAVCRTILDYSDGCSGGYACRTGLHYDGTIATFTDGSAVDYLPSLQPNVWGENFAWDEGMVEQCAQLADGNDDSMNCNNLRTFAGGGGSCDSTYHKNKGLCQIWPGAETASTITTTPKTTAGPTTLATSTTSTATMTTTKPDPILCPDGSEPIPNTFCGRGPGRADCGIDQFCHIDPTDRFAVCCLVETETTTTTPTSTTTTAKPDTTTTTETTTTATTASTTTTDSVEATEFICPTGWTPYGNNKKCLKVVNQGKSFSGHESNCQRLAPEGWSGSLMSFHSQDDLDVAGAVCRTILDYSDGCSGGYACRTGLHFDGTVASFTDGSTVDYLTSSKPNMWDEGKEQCAQLADGNDESLNCNNLRTFADGGGSCDSSYHKNKGLCQIWPDTISSAASTTTTATRTTTAEPTTLATTTSTTATTTTTTKPTTTTTTPTTTTKSTTTEKSFPTINTVASVDGLVCPQGQTFVDLGYSCALNKQTFQLVVTSPGKLGIPKRSGCSPGNGVAGGGKGGCSYCDEDNTQNTERTLIWWMSGDCPAKAPLAGTFAPKLEDLILSEDGIDLCSLDYERNDGGDYITSDLGGKFEGFLQTIFCMDIPPAYSLIDQKKSFSEARAYCQSYGSDLASITSAEENAEVASLCERATNDVLCWIGLSDEAAEGSPQWLDGSEYEFENWNSASGGNPNASQHESRDVVTISGIQSNWMDYGAWEYTCGQREESLKRVFICGGDVPDVP